MVDKNYQGTIYYRLSSTKYEETLSTLNVTNRY